MPNRIVRETILSSESVCSLDWNAELFYRRLMSIVDDYGRYEANPALLRAKCYPLQVDRVRGADISRWMAACQTAGLIVLYVGVNGKHYLEITKFGQQQRSPSKFPEPMKISKQITCVANDIKRAASAHLVVVGDVVEGVSVVEGEKQKRLRAPEVLCFPENLDTEDFQAAWTRWSQHRSEIRKPLKPTSQAAQLKQFAEWGPERSIAAIDHSIANGWTGVFEPKPEAGGRKVRNVASSAAEFEKLAQEQEQTSGGARK